MSLCSRAQRPMGMGLSARAVWRRSVIVARAVDALGLEGMKKTLLTLVFEVCWWDWGVYLPCCRHCGGCEGIARDSSDVGMRKLVWSKDVWAAIERPTGRYSFNSLSRSVGVSGVRIVLRV